MAALRRLTALDLGILKNINTRRNYSQIKRFRDVNRFEKLCLCVAGGSLLLFASVQWKKISTVHAFKAKKKDEDLKRAVKLTSRERRFIKFASVEYDGQLYMTPQDFLESVVEQEPRPRLKRRFLTEKEVEQIRDHTPSLKKGSSEMFRKLRDKGIISYTEYLFLLSILTKPQSGFRIAFNMFDTDGNERVDKNEFLVLVDILTKHSKKEITKKEYDKDAKYAMEKIFSHAWKDKRGISEDNAEGNEEKGPIQEQYVDDEQGLQRRHSVDTTLITHFFGKKGKDELKYEGFRKFMENLQSEVLELEFHEFSKGHNTISEVDFARILLRYTYLDTDESNEQRVNIMFEVYDQTLANTPALDFRERILQVSDTVKKKPDCILWNYPTPGIRIYPLYKSSPPKYVHAFLSDMDTSYDMFLDRLLDRVKEERGITLDEFKAFCQFLNNLEDFAIAMKMYTLADHPISKDEFHRAVKICTGNSLSRHLVHTVFAIFDEDGDGHLSYREFIAIMKDRLHRGFKSYAKNDGWDAFKFCVKQEMKTPS